MTDINSSKQTSEGFMFFFVLARESVATSLTLLSDVAGEERGDWEWIEADKVWRTTEFPKTHRGTNPPGRHDVTLLRQWYTRALNASRQQKSGGGGGGGGGAATVTAGKAGKAGKASSAAATATATSRGGGGATKSTAASDAAAATERIAAEVLAVEVEETLNGDGGERRRGSTSAAYGVQSAARVEEHRRAASVHVQASHELIRQVMVHCYDRGALLAEAGVVSELNSVWLTNPRA